MFDLSNQVIRRGRRWAHQEAEELKQRWEEDFDDKEEEGEEEECGFLKESVSERERRV